MEETSLHITKAKEAYLKGLHTVEFQLFDILEKAELWNQLNDE